MLEQRFQRLLSLIAEGIVERLCRQPAGAGASGQTDALQRVRARQHEPLRLYLTAQAGQDDAPVVGGERCPGSQVHRCSHVVRRHERTQAEMPDGQPPVVGARCPPWSRSGPEMERAPRSARPARRPGERAVRCRRARLGPNGAAVRCGAPARGGSPGAGAYRSNQDHHRPEDSCAPAKRCRRESRVALRHQCRYKTS